MLNVLLGPILNIGKEIIGGVNDHFKSKRELKRAEVDAKLRILEKTATHDMDWERLWAQQAAESWKDEWWTIVVSIPLIMVFVPSLQHYVFDGFTALQQLPEWYQQLVMIAFGASFGVRIVPKGVNIVKELLKK